MSKLQAGGREQFGDSLRSPGQWTVRAGAVTSSQAPCSQRSPACPFTSRLWERVETVGGQAAGLEA